jgi:uncharacterized protein YukE
LVTAASNLGGNVTQLNSTIDAQRNALRELAGSWQGKALEAALTRAERDLSKQTELRDQLEQLPGELRSVVGDENSG